MALTQVDQGLLGTNAQYTGFKNRLINSAMVIDQRNAGASVTPANNDFSVDRWRCLLTQSSKFTIQQNAGSVTPPTGYGNYVGVTSSSAYSVTSTDSFTLLQNIEGFNTSDLAFGTASASSVALSFWVRSSLTGTFGGSLSNSAVSRSYPFSYTISSANTWEYKTITIAGDTSGTWIGATNGIGLRIFFNLGSGSTYSGTAGSWASADYRAPTGATSVVGTNGATFYITGVQLEKGSTATSFDYLDYGRSLIQCQRYFQKSYAYATLAGASGFDGIVGRTGTAGSGSFTTGEIFWCLIYPVAMRTTPTFSLYDSSGNAGKCTRTAFNVADYTNQNADVVSGNEKSALLRSATGTSAGAACFQYYSTAEL